MTFVCVVCGSDRFCLECSPAPGVVETPGKPNERTPAVAPGVAEGAPGVGEVEKGGAMDRDEAREQLIVSVEMLSSAVFALPKGGFDRAWATRFVEALEAFVDGGTVSIDRGDLRAQSVDDLVRERDEATGAYNRACLALDKAEIDRDAALARCAKYSERTAEIGRELAQVQERHSKVHADAFNLEAERRRLEARVAELEAERDKDEQAIDDLEARVEVAELEAESSTHADVYERCVKAEAYAGRLEAAIRDIDRHWCNVDEDRCEMSFKMAMGEVERGPGGEHPEPASPPIDCVWCEGCRAVLDLTDAKASTTWTYDSEGVWLCPQCQTEGGDGGYSDGYGDGCGCDCHTDAGALAEERAKYERLVTAARVLVKPGEHKWDTLCTELDEITAAVAEIGGDGGEPQ